MINVGIDAVALSFAITTVAPTQKSTGFLVFVVGLVFLFNGAVRIIDGVRKSYPHKMSADAQN